MIQKLFLLVISLSISFANCHDDFTPSSFEESSDSLIEFIQEQFLDKNISFFPTQKEIEKLHLKAEYKVTKSGKFPNKSGIYKIEQLTENLSKIRILLKEPDLLGEMQAFNNYNDTLGGLFYDYNIDAIKMELKPYEARAYYQNRDLKNSYFGVSITIYGIKDDATGLKNTRADIAITNYTPWVKANIKCKGSK